jgi:outer membrane protein insertion porin family
MILFLMGLSAWAVPAEVEIPTIAEGMVSKVEFVGYRNIDVAALYKAVTVREGVLLNPDLIRSSIRALYTTGYIDDVRVDVKDGFVRFFVSEKPAIRSWKVRGNKEFADDVLTELIEEKELRVVNESLVGSLIQEMRDKYLEKGYYLVEITPIYEPVSAGQVHLIFEIEEKQKVAVKRLEFTGNDSVPDSKIVPYLQTRPAGPLPFLGSGAFNELILDNDIQIIRSVFMEEGFAEVKVDPPHTFLSMDKRFIYISINIEEGLRYRLGSITVEGDISAEEGLSERAMKKIIAGESAKNLTERWNKSKDPSSGWEAGFSSPLSFSNMRPPLQTGDLFKRSTLQMVMKELSDLYGDRGYAFANVVPLTKPNKETGEMNIVFQIQKGKKVRIDRIDIIGNDPTIDKVVRREIPIAEGDWYTGSGIEEARMRLMRLGFFEDVNITTPRAKNMDELDLKVDVVEQPTGSFSVGAGFSNLENFMFNANISKNNFLGRGYTMSVAANLSSVRQQGNLQIYDPYFLDSRWTLRVHGYSISRQFIEDEYQRGGSLAVGRYLDKRDDLRLEFNYTFEDTGLTSIDAYKEKLLGGQLYRNGLTSTAGISFVADKRNNRIQPTRGLYTVLSANLSGGFSNDSDQLVSLLGGDFNFYELKLNMRLYKPLVESEMLIFRYNGTLGHLGSTDGQVIPYIHRYRAGGINSIRGYNWFSLGPSLRAQGANSNSTQSIFSGSDDPESAEDRLVVGGTQTWINNVEIESPILRAAGVSLVVFFDAGSAFGDPWGNGTINFSDLRLSYGGGIRWVSPMGPLRFEYGIPINRRPGERESVFDFSMGSLF